MQSRKKLTDEQKKYLKECEKKNHVKTYMFSGSVFFGLSLINKSPQLFAATAFFSYSHFSEGLNRFNKCYSEAEAIESNKHKPG